MSIILLHTSKTMRQPSGEHFDYQEPALLTKTRELSTYLRTLSPTQIESSMKVSSDLAKKTKSLIEYWTVDPVQQQPAIDAFLGDIYSGLQVQTFSQKDREYANNHLYILSGQYGVLRALDSVYPYRLEMGYKLPDEPFKNLYKFWADAIAKTLPDDKLIFDLSAVEYSKAVLPYLKNRTIIAPKFLTRDQKTGEAKFVVVHAKIARGAFARWLIQNHIDIISDFKNFTDLGYKYDTKASTDAIPVFVCDQFGGLGLSVRLTLR